ncbi:hypothetical protein B4099_1257 [Heyndrickxia coagulans]|uniref:Uncharacterized protein n=1 Tax=Heyndrickxia coagulans TaxID=1398 RepID=A0A150KFF9_HEYCO|nr:hypothetical protein B4099_1257 [Heyndrickxia coagulans]
MPGQIKTAGDLSAVFHISKMEVSVIHFFQTDAGFGRAGQYPAWRVFKAQSVKR